MHRFGVVACCAAVVLVARGAAAAPAVAPPDTLAVTADASTAPAVGAVTTRIEIADRPGARDLADILAATAGLQIRRYGAAGASAVPSLRGSAPGQIRLFVDGMPMDDAQTGLVDLSRLPLERFTAVEVHRGGVPVRLGGIGGAGAVDLRTRDAAPGVEISAGAGSFGEVHGRAVWGTGSSRDPGALLLLVHGRRADNDFPYTDHNWTFHVPGDDRSAVRENSWLREHGVFLSGRRDLGRAWELRGWLGGLRRDGGRPGPVGGFASPHASVRYDRADGYVTTGWRQGLVRLEVAGARTDQRLDDPAGEVGFLPPGVTDSSSDEVTLRSTWSPTLDCGRGCDLLFRGGVEGRGQWYRETFNGQDDPLRNRKQVTLFAAADAGFAGGRLRVAPSLRWQRNVDDFPPLPPLPYLPEETGVEHRRDDLSPAVGVTWEVAPGALVWGAHAARSVRVPTWIELFGHRGGIAGNRELQPERITSLDMELTGRTAGGGLVARVAVFHAETDSTIVFEANSQQTSRAINSGRTRTRGVEVEAQWRLPVHLELQANATFQRARDISGRPPYDGKALPYLPDREAFLRLRRDDATLAPWLEVLLQSSNYRDRYNWEAGRMPARAQWNLGLAWTLRPGWLGPGGALTLAGAVLNLTDNDVYDIEGFPLPGRSWRASVRLRP